MKAAVIVEAGQPRLEALARELARGLESAGFGVEILTAESGSFPKSMAAYDLIALGGTGRGFLGKQIPAALSDFVARCTRLEGKRAVAFTTPRTIGTTRVLKGLMGLLEKQGANVVDFMELKNAGQAREFGARQRAGEP